MVTPEQCRAARAWLGWTQAQLAERASVGISTIKDFEGKSRTPIQNNHSAIQRTLEEAGLQFLFDAKDKAVGVALDSYKPKK